MNAQVVLTRMQELCLANSLSRADIGRLLVVDNHTSLARQKYITFYKRGELFMTNRYTPKIDDIKRFAEYFNKPLSYFIIEETAKERLISSLYELGADENKVLEITKYISKQLS